MRTFGKVIIAITAVGLAATTVSACSSDKKSPIANITSVSGKSTSVALNSAFVAALTSLKVTPGVSGTATVTSQSPVTVSFPITGGHVKVYKKGDVTPYVQGVVDHNGSGLTLKAGSTTVGLKNFVVNPGNNSNLTGEVDVNGAVAAKSAKLFDLNGGTLKPITVDKSTGVATLTGTTVLLSSDAAKLLNSTFKINALKAGLEIGIATLLVNTK